MEITGKDRIFLTPEEAVAAIREDFLQYESQKHLFLNLIPSILGEGTAAVKEDRRDGIWLKLPHGSRKFLTYSQLGEYLAAALENAHPPIEALARICGMVFRTSACTGESPDGKRIGIWIETGTEGFRCRQCGRCCRSLSYHSGCSVRDYEAWQAAGRSDIMDWVGVVRGEGRIISCRIWILPGTRQYAKVCPWLRKEDRNIHECTIYDLRPGICRQYPGSRKHAEMTGCSGFEPL